MCVRACVHACVYACLCVCVCVCVHITKICVSQLKMILSVLNKLYISTDPLLPLLFPCPGWLRWFEIWIEVPVAEGLNIFFSLSDLIYVFYLAQHRNISVQD